MPGALRFDLTLLPGAPALLAAHERELPQRDDLCGAFCGALALHAAGINGADSQPLDQDAVALAAGSVVSRVAEHGHLPRGEPGRRDYRLAPPLIDDADVSGTTAAGLVRALAELSRGRLAALPYAGPWTERALEEMFELAAARERPVALLANIATRHLWGAGASAAQLIAYLCDGRLDGPPPDWDVGHFVGLAGRVAGPAGSLYVVADTYPSLGARGVHLQPVERLALALQRAGMAAGGIVVVVDCAEAAAVRAGAAELGLREEVWDNGSVTLETPR